MSEAGERGVDGARRRQDGGTGEGRREGIWLAATIVGLVAVICSLFALVGLLILLALFLTRQGQQLSSPFMLKLLAKAALFAVLSVAGGGGLFVLARRRPAWCSSIGDPVDVERPPRQVAPLTFLLLVLGLAAALAFTNLDGYPRAEPDETHHLIVARNLAEYGLYASGNPEKGFKVLDDYDSVGPTVILLIGAAMRAFGTSIVSARLVIGIYFLALCCGVFVLLRAPFGAWAAGLGALMVVTAQHSTYLARSLYGEVPALFFLVVGLCVWRAALRSKGVWLGLLAGLLFGASVLSKAFMLNAAWAFLGALLYDRMTFRRIELRHLMAPAAGAIVVMGAWWAVQKMYQQGGVDIAVDTLSVYQEKLLFGLSPLPRTVGWILRQPLTLGTAMSVLGLVASLVSLACAAPLVFRKRYDPATLVLFFFVPFVTYWWVFFTTGNVPRYAWYAWAGAGVFTGLFAWSLAKRLAGRTAGSARLVAALLLLIVLLPAFERTRSQGTWVLTLDQMQAERQLASYLEDMPQDASIATTAWPLERSMDFLAGRNIRRFNRVTDNSSDYDVVIWDTKAYDPRDEGLMPAGPNGLRSFGRYAAYEPKGR